MTGGVGGDFEVVSKIEKSAQMFEKKETLGEKTKNTSKCHENPI